MKIEALESIKSDGYLLDPEDIKTVTDDVGARWCAAGWARDVSGVVATGERKVLNAKLSVNNINLAVKSAKIGVQ
jgi:hypothetical protein